MTEGWKTPRPDDLETTRQFWDVTLDRLVVFVQAKHQSNVRGATLPQPPKFAPRSD